MTRYFYLRATLITAACLSSIVSGGHPQPQSPDSTLSAPRVGLLSLCYPEMQSLEEEVREQLQFFQKHLATLAGNQETTDADLGEAYPTPAPFIDDAVAVGSEACQRALCRQPSKGARRIAVGDSPQHSKRAAQINAPIAVGVETNRKRTPFVGMLKHSTIPIASLEVHGAGTRAPCQGKARVGELA